MTRRAVVIAWFVAAAAASIAACGDASPATRAPLDARPGTTTAPFALGPGAAESAAFGDAVAVVSPSWGSHLGEPADGPAVAAMSPDGTWRELPEPAPVGIRRLLSTDRGLLLLGREDGRLRLQFLGPTDAAWSELPLPRLPFGGETEFWEESTAGEVAVMGTSDGWLVRHGTDQVRFLERDARSGARMCVVDGELIALGSDLAAANGVRPGDEHTVDAVRRLDPPPGIDPRTALTTCGPNGPIVLGDGSELSYDAHAGEWSSRPLTLPEAIGPITVFSSHGVLDDGTVLTLDPNGQILRRSPTGEWTDTGVRGTGLVTTGSSAYGVGPDGVVAIP